MRLIILFIIYPLRYPTLQNINKGRGIFVDTGNPNSDGPLDVSEVTFSKTFDHSPKHSNKFKSHVKTVATPRYDVMGLLCHSAGCDITLKMIQDQTVTFNASAFLEPVSRLIGHLDITNIPALVYGTEMAQVGPEKCNIPGIDYKVLYPEWKCPEVEIEVAHVNICARPPIEIQRTSMATRQAAQGIVSGFFTNMLQGRKDAIRYITHDTKVPIKLLFDGSDLNC